MPTRSSPPRNSAPLQNLRLAHPSDGPPATDDATPHVLHRVLLYRTDDELLCELTGYFDHTLADGADAVVIATLQRRRALRDALAARRAAGARHAGQLTMLDADQTLSLFMRDQRPVPELFDRSVGALVRAYWTSTRAPSLYGEMVALLWRDGNVAGALELENLWSELLRRVPCELLCAYPLADAVAPVDGLAKIALRHSTVYMPRMSEPGYDRASTTA